MAFSDLFGGSAQTSAAPGGFAGMFGAPPSAEDQKIKAYQSQDQVYKANATYSNSFKGLMDNMFVQPAKQYLSDSVAQAKKVGSEIAKDPLGTAYRAYQAPTQEIAKAASSSFNSAVGAVDDMKTAKEGQGSTSGDVADLATLASGVAGTLFSPITGLFNTAERIPGLKQVADAVNVPISATGVAGAYATGKIVDVLPISKESKDVLKGPLQQLGSLAAQVALGGKVMDIAGGYLKRGVEITPEVANQIVQEAKAGQPAAGAEPTAGVQAPQTGFGKLFASPEKTGLAQAHDEYTQAQGYVKPEVGVLPNEPVPAESTGETVPSKLASRINEQAIEDKLTTGFDNLPEYNKVNKKEQAQFAVDMLQNEPDKAMSIAMGQELPPAHILPESIFLAVEQQARDSGDVETLHKLATESTMSSQATAMGQRISMLSEREGDSPVEAIKDVQNARIKAVEKKGKTTIDKLKKSGADEIQGEIKKATSKRPSWEEFMDQLTCNI